MKMKKSSQPRKQRKAHYSLDLHINRKMMSAHLSPELRKKYGTRNIPVRKGDRVKVMGGKHRKKEGKIAQVALRKMMVSIEGIAKKKLTGIEKPVWFYPSSLMIIELDLKDKKREEVLKRRQKVER